MNSSYHRLTCNNFEVTFKGDLDKFIKKWKLTWKDTEKGKQLYDGKSKVTIKEISEEELSDEITKDMQYLFSSCEEIQTF